MTQELLAAFLMLLLAPLHAMLSVTVNTLLAGYGWATGNREKAAELPQWAARFGRSHTNFMESMPSFVGLILLAYVLKVSDPVTVNAAWVFVGARLLYITIYTAGIKIIPIRTLTWLVSVGAMAAIALHIFQATVH